MNHKRPPVPVIVIVLLVIVLSAYFLITQSLADKNSALTASGFIEATQVNVAPELAGKVTEVLVAEGQPVSAGDTLLRLDPSLLTAQRAVAAAALQTANSAAQTAQDAHAVAQAQYNLTLASARAEVAKIRTRDWAGTTPSYFEQPKWYFTQAEQIAAAEAGIQSAATDVNAAQTNLDKVIADINNAKFVEVETRLANAQVAYLAALNTYSRAQASDGGVSPDNLPVYIPPVLPGYRTRIGIAQQMSDNQDLTDAAQAGYDAAKAELDSAQQAYDDLLSTDAADNVLKARAELSVALERFQAAQDQLSLLQMGEHSLRVAAASATLEQTKTAARQSLDAAKQSEANLALLDVQIAKLTVYAPLDGVVLTRGIEVGEFVQPGATTFVLGKLGNLTITVYIPEDRYGQLSLGQQATVTVDSFPGVTFTATVIQIADKAEFTPRNVQTVEGRSSTVYAIKLSVDNPDGKLKIGMPADVVFQ
jgi:HlyD family secretion protein